MFVENNVQIQENVDMEGQYFLITKIKNKFMQHGKKTIVDHISLQIRLYVKKIWRHIPKKAFSWLFDHIKPILGLFAKRQGKMYTFIPAPLQNNRPIVVSLKWFVQNVKAKHMPKRLHDRIILEIAYIFFNSRHSIVQRRNGYYDIIYDHRSNMRYRWK